MSNFCLPSPTFPFMHNSPFCGVEIVSHEKLCSSCLSSAEGGWNHFCSLTCCHWAASNIFHSTKNKTKPQLLSLTCPSLVHTDFSVVLNCRVFTWTKRRHPNVSMQTFDRFLNPSECTTNSEIRNERNSLVYVLYHFLTVKKKKLKLNMVISLLRMSWRYTFSTSWAVVVWKWESCGLC